MVLGPRGNDSQHEPLDQSSAGHWRVQSIIARAVFEAMRNVLTYPQCMLVNLVLALHQETSGRGTSIHAVHDSEESAYVPPIRGFTMAL